MMRAPVFGKVVWKWNRKSLMIKGFSNGIDLQEPDGNAQSDTRTPQSTLIIRHGPRVTRQRLQDACKLEFALLRGQQKAGGTKGLRRKGLTGAWSSTVLRAQSEHILNLLRRVLLATPEHVGLAALRVSEFVDLRLFIGQIPASEDSMAGIDIPSYRR